MRLNVENTLSLFVFTCLILASMIALVRAGTPLTREEAIEISRHSKLMQSLLENADWYTLIQAEYSNTTQSTKGNFWYIQWHIHPYGASSGGHIVTHKIDEETGEILYEGWLGLR